VREDGREEDKIEFAVSERKSILRRIEPSARVIHDALNVRELKSKIWVSTADMALAPTDSLRDDVNSFITACLQIFREWSCHSPDSATHLQYSVLGPQSTRIDEIPQELISCRFKITIPRAIKVPGRDQFLATPKQ
jgi:hypothetical protein